LKKYEEEMKEEKISFRLEKYEEEKKRKLFLKK